MLNWRWVVFVAIVATAAGGVSAIGSVEVSRLTSTDAFCTSCHSMTHMAADTHFQKSVHRANAVGVRATCSDCHIPKTNWFIETYAHVTMGAKDLVAEYTHDFSDANVWEKTRIELAHYVRNEMRRNGSVTCRGCHDVAAIHPASRAERTAHEFMNEKHLSCIDCHFNIAHASVAPKMTFVIPEAVTVGQQAVFFKYFESWLGSGFLDHFHESKGVTCALCHGTNAPTSAAPKKYCLNCHAGSYKKLASKTMVSPNPHASHLGQVNCSKCHKVHEKPVIYCNQCHKFQNLKMPELSAKE